MGTLTTCLKKAGAALDASDRAAILARSRVLRKEGRSANDAAIAAIDERIAELQAQLRVEDKPAEADVVDIEVKERKQPRTQRTVMGSEALGALNRAGGISPSLLPLLSQRVGTKRISRKGKPIVQWRNPPTQLGLLFRAGGISDRGELARVLEEAGYLAPGSVAADFLAASEKAGDMIRAALNQQEVMKEGDPDDIEAQMRREMEMRMDQTADYPDLDPESAAEAEAERAAIMADGDVSQAEMAAPTDDETADAASTDQAALMRALGFSEQEIADELAQGQGSAPAELQGEAAQALQAQPGEGAPADAAGGAEAGSGPEEVALESQTEDDLRARAEREQAARKADEREQKRLADKAKADAERGEFTLTGSDRPADVAAAAGQGGLFGSEQGIAEQERSVYAVRESEGSRDIPIDLFPETVQADTRAGVRRPRRQGAAARDVHAEPAVPNVIAVRQDPAFPGLYHVSTQLVEVGRRDLPVKHVRSWPDAALALASLGRYAVEHFDALVTDKDGKPLAIIGSFKGARASTSVEPATLLAEALRIEGAADVWGAHNHPSGNPVLSQADLRLNQVIGAVFRPSTVRWRGLSAIGRDAGDGSPVFRAAEADVESVGGPIPIATRTQTSVPIVERTIMPRNTGMPKIESPQDLRDVVSKIAADSKTRILMLDASHRVTALVDVVPAEMAKLRVFGRFDRLINSTSEAGADRAVIINPSGVMPETTLRNIMAALRRADVQTLDVIDPETGVSMAERNTLPLVGSEVYAQLTGWESAADPSTVASARAEIASLFGNAADKAVTVVATADDLPADKVDVAAFKAAGATAVTVGKNHVYIVADRIPKGNVRGTVMHELGVHYGMPKDAIARLTEQVRAWAKGDGPLADLARDVLNAAKRSSSTNRDEETLAYMVQALVDAGVEPTLAARSFLRRVMAAIKDALRRLGLEFDMTPQDVVDYAYGAAKMALERGSPQAEPGVSRRDALRLVAGAAAAGVGIDAEAQPAGMLEPGNIDLTNRPRVRNADGSVSTVRSMSINVDGREVLIPTVSEDGRVLKDAAAILQYRRTGKHLGIFKTPAAATAYAKRLSADQARRVGADYAGDQTPRMDFSQASIAETLRHAATARGFSEIVQDWTHTEQSLNWWHKTVGTMYGTAYAKDANGRYKRPGFKRVFDIAQDFLHFTSALANEAADMAPDIVPRLDTLGDVWRNLRLSEADKRALSAPIFRGTLVDQKVYSDAELRSQFDLSDKQIGMYRQFRAAVNASLDQLVASEALRTLKGAPESLRELVKTDRAGLRQALMKWLDEKAEADPKNWADTRKNIAEIYGRVDGLKKQGYAPLMRFGRFTVYVTDPAGEQVFFGMYETEREATRAARQWRAREPQATVAQGTMSQEQYKLFRGMSPETMELFARVTGMDKHEAFQEYIRYAKANNSALKRRLERKGIAGYSEDISRVLASFLTSNARLASRNLHFGDMDEAVEAIPKEQGDLKDHAEKLREFVQGQTEEAAGIRGLLFVQYIGGSLASAFVNMTQPLTMTFPYLSQFGGPVRAAAYLTAAIKDAATGRVADAELREALAEADREGITAPQEIHQLQAEATRTMAHHPLVRKALFLWGAPFSLAEQFNRRSTFIAAYRIARATGKPDPFKFATDAVAQTQGIYNRGNRPEWARGAIGATLMTFKQFSIAYIEFLSRLPKREKALALAVLVAAAGMQGLPFADDLDDLIDTIGQRLGYDTNVKLWKHRVLTDAFGAQTAQVLMHGFSAVPGMPLDVAARMSVGNLIPGTGALLKSTTDKGRDVAEVAGPAGSSIADAFEAAGLLLQGDVKKAVEGVVPVAIRNLYKAVDIAETGMYRDQKGRKVVDADGWDAITKGVGFQPSAVAKEQRGTRMQQQQVNLARNVEAEIAEKWAAARFEGDREAEHEAREQMLRWNRNNPQSPIVISGSQIAKRVINMRRSQRERVERAAPREMRPMLQQ